MDKPADWPDGAPWPPAPNAEEPHTEEPRRQDAAADADADNDKRNDDEIEGGEHNDEAADDLRQDDNLIDFEARKRERDAEFERIAGIDDPFERDEAKKKAQEKYKRGARVIEAAIKKAQAKRRQASKFAMTNDGLMVQGAWSAQPFDIVALARDVTSADESIAWSAIVRFRNPEGETIEAPVSKASLIKEPNVALGALADRGMAIKTSRKTKEGVAEYISAADPQEYRIIAKRVGWSADCRSFLLPDRLIGGNGSERVIWQAGDHNYTSKGTLGEWTGDAAVRAGMHRLTRFYVAAALAGPLLKLGNFESGIIHLHGFSSLGKTTAAVAAASVWGEPVVGKFIRPWRTTANALETSLASACDTLLPLDETGQANHRDIATVAYEVAGQAGKSRMNRDATAKTSHTWRTLVVSTGEKPLAEAMKEKGATAAAAGQLVRAVDIAVPDRPLGVFDGFWSCPDEGFVETGRMIADRIKEAALKNYGHAGPEFVRQLIERGITGEDIRKRVNAFVGDAQGQEGRVKERFALVAVAGELADEFGIVNWGCDAPIEKHSEATFGPWRPVIHADALALFEDWQAKRGAKGPAEPEQIVAHVRRLIEAHGESRFDDITPLPVDKDGNAIKYEPRPVINRLGYREFNGDDRLWYIPRETFRAEFCDGRDPATVAKTLLDKGMLVRGEGRNLLKNKRLPGAANPVRMYWINAKILQ